MEKYNYSIGKNAKSITISPSENLHTLPISPPVTLAMLVSICNITTVRVLTINDVKLEILPPEIGRMIHLVNVDLSKNLICELPREFSKCANLNELNLSHNQFARVPTVLAKFKSLKILYLAANKLDTFAVHIKSLRFLDISNNNFTELPEILYGKHQLSTLLMDGNFIRSIGRVTHNIHGTHNTIIRLGAPAYEKQHIYINVPVWGVRDHFKKYEKLYWCKQWHKYCCFKTRKIIMIMFMLMLENRPLHMIPRDIMYEICSYLPLWCWY